MLWDYTPDTSTEPCGTDGCEVTAPHSHLPADRPPVTGGKLVGYFHLTPDAQGRAGFVPLEIPEPACGGTDPVMVPDTESLVPMGNPWDSQRADPADEDRDPSAK
jgi:hypothetical protein